MFIQTEPTPNPDTVKFIPGQTVVGSAGPFDYPNVDAASASPLARALFDVQGVKGVFLGSDFLSISKDSETDWKHVRPMVLAAIMDHFMAVWPRLKN